MYEYLLLGKVLSDLRDMIELCRYEAAHARTWSDGMSWSQAGVALLHEEKLLEAEMESISSKWENE